jgi:REP element-mobilizing transposase RayT
MPYKELTKGRCSEHGRAYLITTITMSRVPVFSDFDAARLLTSEMRSLNNAGVVESLAWVVMPDHLHWVFNLGEATDLSAVMKSLKAKASREINRLNGKKGSVWQPGFHDHALRREEDFLAIARYVVMNPVRAGLVKSVKDYPHWDSVWL